MEVDLNVLSSQLRNIEERVRPSVLEFNVGVNNLALSEEKENQLGIQKNVESVISALNSLKPADAKIELEKANSILKVIKGKSDAIQYLKSISRLESLFSDVSKAVTLTSVNLSSECATANSVLKNHFLENSVQQCWEYASQLSLIASMHLKAAADFHQFKHSVNEIRQHAKQISDISNKTVEGFRPNCRIDQASYLHNELQARLRIFLDLSGGTKKLMRDSERLLSIENRLITVKNGRCQNSGVTGPVKVQALMTIAQKGYTIKKGEILPLVDTTEKAHLWKVQTSKGVQYIPSVACIVIVPNESFNAEALVTEKEVSESWKLYLQNYRQVLVKYYTECLSSFKSIESSDKELGVQFFEETKHLLLNNNKTACELSSLIERLSETSPIDEAGNDDLLNSTKLQLLQKPLKCYGEHIRELEDFKMLTESYQQEMKQSAKKFLQESNEMSTNLDRFRAMNDQRRKELDKLCARVQNWKVEYGEELASKNDDSSRRIYERNPSISRSTSGISSEDSFKFGNKRVQLASKRKTKAEVMEEQEPKFVRDVSTQIMVFQKLRKFSTVNETVTFNLPRTQSHPNQLDCMTQVGVLSQTRELQVEKNSDDSDKNSISTQSTATGKIRSNQKNCQTWNSKMRNNRDCHKKENILTYDLQTQIGHYPQRTARSKEVCDIEATFSAHGTTTFRTNSETHALDGLYETTGIQNVINSTQAERNQNAVETIRGREICIDFHDYGQPSKLKYLDSDLTVMERDAFSPMIFATKPTTQKVNSEIATRSSRFEKLDSSMYVRPIYSENGVEVIGHTNHENKVGQYESMNFSFHNKIQSIETKPLETSRMGIRDMDVSFNETGYSNSSAQLKEAFMTNEEFSLKQNNRLCCCDLSSNYRSKGTKQTKDGDKTQIVFSDIVRNSKMYDSEVQYDCPKHMKEDKLERSNFLHTKIIASCQTTNSEKPLSVYELCHSREMYANSSKKAVFCQVGTILVPKEIKVTEKRMKCDNQVNRLKFGSSSQTILYPTSIELESELTEKNGIHIIGLEEVKQIEMRNEHGSFIADVEQETTHLKNRTEYMEQHISNDRKTINSTYTNKNVPESNTSRPVLVTLGCQLHIKNVECGAANNNSRESMMNRTKYGLVSSYCQDPEYNIDNTQVCLEQICIEQNCITSSKARSVESQVGLKMTPSVIQVANVKSDKKTISEAIGMPVDAVVFPSTFNFESELTETTGVQVVDISNMSSINLQSGGRVFHAEILNCNQDKSNARNHAVEINRKYVYNSIGNKADISDTCVSQQKSRIENTSNDISLGNANLTFKISAFETKSLSYSDKCEISVPDSRHFSEKIAGNSTEFQPDEAVRLKIHNISEATCQLGVGLETNELHLEDMQTETEKRESNLQTYTMMYPSIMNFESESGKYNESEVSKINNASKFDVQVGMNINETNVEQALSKEAFIYGDDSEKMVYGCTEFDQKNKASTSVSAKQMAICDINIGRKRAGSICMHCSGSGKSMSTTNEQSSMIGEGKIFSSIKVSHWTTKSSEIGTLLIPTSVSISKAGIKEIDKEGANIANINVDSGLCPAVVDVHAMFTKASGITIANLNDMENIQFEIGKQNYIATIESDETKTGTAFQLEEKKGLGTYSTSNFSCQVGVLLKPTGLHIGNIRIEGDKKQSNIKTCAAIYPSIMNLQAEIGEFNGIEVSALKDIDKIEVQDDLNIYEANLERVLSKEVVQDHNDRNKFVYGYSQFGGKIRANNLVSAKEMVTCDINIKGTQIGSICMNCSGSGRTRSISNKQSFKEGEEKISSSIEVNKWTTASSEFGNLLIPTSVRISKFGMTAIDQGSANLANTKVDSVSCPDTVGVHAIFTKASEITIANTNDMENLQFEIGDQSYFATIEANHSKSCNASQPGTKELLRPYRTSNVSCQVGVMLKPSGLQLGNIKTKIDEQKLNLETSIAVYPSIMNLQAEIGEFKGIEVGEIEDLDEFDVHDGMDIYKASAKQELSGGVVLDHNGHEELVYGYTKFDPKTKIYNYFGAEGMSTCNINIKGARIGSTCIKCGGSGKSKSIENSKSYVEGREEMHGECKLSQWTTKSSQVGTVLIPTGVSISKVRMTAIDKESANVAGISLDSVLHAAAIDVQSMLTDKSGITIENLNRIENLQLGIEDKNYIATIEANQSKIILLKSDDSKSNVCRLEIRSDEKSVGSASVENQLSILSNGCEFRLKEDKITLCSHCQLSQSNEKLNSKAAHIKHEEIYTAKKNASSQVGIMLVPTTVLVSDMQIDITDTQMGENLKLPCDAILCPSTVNLNTELIDSSGIEVLDVRDVTNISIVIGKNTYNASLEQKTSKIKDMTLRCEPSQSCSLKLTSGCRESFTKSENSISDTMKRIDQHLGCTFVVNGIVDNSNKEGMCLSNQKSISQRLPYLGHKYVDNSEKIENQDCPTKNASSQVGIMITPDSLKIYPQKFSFDDQKLANCFGVANSSNVLTSTMAMSTHISEKSGVTMTKIHELENINLEIGNKRYKATVEGYTAKESKLMSTQELECSNTVESSESQLRIGGKEFGSSRGQIICNSCRERRKGEFSNIPHINSYIMKMPTITTDLDNREITLFEMCEISDGEKRIRFQINENIQSQFESLVGSFTSRDACVLNDLSIGTTDGNILMQKSNIGIKQRTVRCDVACEALILPITMAKRVQTTWI